MLLQSDLESMIWYWPTRTTPATDLRRLSVRHISAERVNRNLGKIRDPGEN